MSDKDDILEGYIDEPPPSGPSEEEFERKQAAFLKKVDGYIAVVMKPKQHTAAKRLEAVRMLGELGEVKAIKALVTVYQKDKTAGLKDAAAKSLARFKALQFALDDEDEDVRGYAMDLLEAIVLEGKLGKKARFSRRTLVMMAGAMVMTLVVLLGLGGMLAQRKSELTAQLAAQVTVFPTSISGSGEVDLPPQTADAVAKELQEMYEYLSADVAVLRTEMLKIARGDPSDCAVTANFKPQMAYVLPEFITPDQHQSIVDAAEQLNEIVAVVDPIRTAFEGRCNATQEVTAQQGIDFDGELVEVQKTLVSLPALLQQAGVVVEIPPTFTPGLETPTPFPTATDAPTLEPTATLDGRILNKHLNGIQRTLDLMIAARGGFNTNILLYWQEVVTTGGSQGCLQLPAPTLPSNYILPEEEAAQLPPALSEAVIALNSGLELSREAWRNFETGCNTNTLGDLAGVNIDFASRAKEQFESAKTSLDSARP